MKALNEARSEKEKEKIVDMLFERCENDVAESPEKHSLDFITLNVHIRKVNLDHP